MKKRLLILVIIIITLLISSGCVDVTYGFYIKSDGSVERRYEVDVDPEGDYAEYALTVATAQLEGMLEENSEFGEIIVDENNEYDVSLVYSYDSLNEYYRSMGMTGDEVPEPNDAVITKDFLYQYSTSEVFSDIDNEYVADYSESMRSMYFSAIPTVPYDEIIINLEYGTKYTKAYTSNSTTYLIEDNTKIFKWTMHADNCDESRLIISKQANYFVWYSSAIAFSIIVSVILYLIVMLKRKKVNGRDEISL